MVFGYAVSRLRACFRVARTADQLSKLHLVAFWLGLTALGVMGHGATLLRSGDRDIIRAVTDGCLLFALVSSLELIESSLKGAAPVSTVEVEMVPGGGSRPETSAGWKPVKSFLTLLGLFALLLAGLYFQLTGTGNGNWVDAAVGAGLFALALLWAWRKLPRERSMAVDAEGWTGGETKKPA